MNQDHKFITLERIVKNGVVSFGRNVWLATAAIAMMGVTLTILLFAIVANITFNHSIDEFNSRIDITVPLQDNIKDPDLDKLIQRLRSDPAVKSVEYISKVDALKAYREQYANNPRLLNAIAETGNVLRASLIIKPKDPYEIQKLRDLVRLPEVKPYTVETLTDTAKIRENAVNNITNATKLFQKAGAAGILVFILVSIMIIFNTIRMAIFNRRDELVIMRLLGASTWYIRGPFVVETMLYGILAAAISLAVCGGLFAVASSTLQASSLGLLDIGYANTYFSQHLPFILVIQITAGIIIGAASSIIATRRYLKLNR
jgi:cell division transport system permease protein